MINYDLFREHVLNNNLSLADLSKGAGLPEFDLLVKAIGMEEFTVNEVDALCLTMNLNKVDAQRIFFP